MMRRLVLHWVRLPGLLGVLLGTAVAQEPDDALGRAMRDELARSMKELRLANLERPYFIAYQVTDAEMLETSAIAGSLLSSNMLRRRMLAVEVRVGDYAFDNSNFMGDPSTFAIGMGGLERSFSGGELPLDDDYIEIRRRLWLATDAAYKRATETLEQKRAALLNRARRDSLPDFTRGTPTRTVEEQRAPRPPLPGAEALVRELSRIRAPSQMSSMMVDLTVTTTRTRYMNSEGTTSVTTRPLVMLSARASTLASDGAPLAGGLDVVARAFDSLPARERLAREIQLLALRLDSLRTAPLLERYAGPMLFEGRAAAELLAESFAPALAARRAISGRPELEMFLRMTGRLGGASFGDRLGARVMPEFVSVVDDPTLKAHDGMPLLGGYTVDDEGVPGRRKRVVEAGVLRSLLSSRTPVEGAPRSTGNRRGATAAPSNLIVESSRGLTGRELRDRLIALVKRRGLPYGMIVRELGQAASPMEGEPMAMFVGMRGGGPAERSVLRAYRLYADGREELVRAGRLTGIDATTFKDIVAVSRGVTVHHDAIDPSFELPMMFAFGMMAFSNPMSSYVVPSLLFEDVAMSRPARQTPTLPLIPPPEQ